MTAIAPEKRRGDNSMAESYDMGDSKTTVNSQANMLDHTDQPVEDLTIYNFGEHVRVDFFELFKEPDSYKDNALGRTIGDKVIRIGYYNLYTYVQAGIYYILSVIIGAVMSLVWAILTGVNTIVMVWIVQPLFKLGFTWLQLIGTCWRALVRTICDPVWQSAGIYYLLSVIIGAVMSLVWAILTGLNTIIMVWIIQPGIKFFFTWLRFVGVCWKAIIRTFCDPCWQSVGLSLSMIRAKLNLGLGGLKGSAADMIEVQQV